MTTPRTKGISTKVTEEEYRTFERSAAGTTVSEWARAELIKASSGQPDGPAILTEILAELLALRSLVLNLMYAIGRGKPITDDDMQRLIDRVDGDKRRRASKRLVSDGGAAS